MKKYTEILQKAVDRIETGIDVTKKTKKLYEALEQENHHVICGLIDAIEYLKVNENDLLAIALADVSTLIIENDYLETVQLDENIRQRLLRIKSNISIGCLDSTVEKIKTKKQGKKKGRKK